MNRYLYTVSYSDGVGGCVDNANVYLKRVLRTVGVSFLRVAGKDLSTRSTNLVS